MPYVEGFGDEVVIFFASVLLLITLVLIWGLTATQPAPRDIIRTPVQEVEESKKENRLEDSCTTAAPTTSRQNGSNSISSQEVAEPSNQSAEPEIEVGEGITEDINGKSSPEDLPQNPTVSKLPDVSKSESSSDVSKTCTSRSQPTIEDSNRIKIRIKYLNDSQVTADASLQENLGDFKRRQFAEDFENNRLVKLIFNGRLLRGDHLSLTDHGLCDDCVVHCFTSAHPVRNSTTQNSAVSSDDNQGLDIGNMLMPMLFLILAFLWYVRIQYDVLFSGLATFLLLSITVMFSSFFLATFFTSNTNQARDSSQRVPPTDS